MCHIQDLISNIEISLDNKDAFNFYDTNDFLISNIINQISNHSTNKIFKYSRISTNFAVL